MLNDLLEAHNLIGNFSILLQLVSAKPQSHQIVGFPDRTIDDDWAELWPIANVCYDLHLRSYAYAIALKLVVCHHMRLLVRVFVPSSMMGEDRSLDQSHINTGSCASNRGDQQSD